MTKLKFIEKILLAITILLAFIFLIFGLTSNFFAANNRITDVISTIVGIVFWIDLLVLLPLSFFKKTRFAAAIGWLVSSYIFGIATWETGIVATSAIWGGWGVLGGLILAGVGVVLTGIIASLMASIYSGAILLIVGAIFVYGTHYLAMAVGEQADQDSHQISGR
jgi:hypothetical protein